MLALFPLPAVARRATPGTGPLVFDLTLERVALDLLDRSRGPALRAGDVAAAGLQDRFTFLGLQLGQTVAARFYVDARRATPQASLRLALPRWPGLRSASIRNGRGAWIIDGYPGYSFTLDPARGVGMHEHDDVEDFVHEGERLTSLGARFHFRLSRLAGSLA